MHDQRTVSDWIAIAVAPTLERVGDMVGYCRACGLWRCGAAWERHAGACQLTADDHAHLTIGTIICHSCWLCLTTESIRRQSHIVTASGNWYSLDLDHARDRDQARGLLCTQTLPVVLITTSGMPGHQVLRARVGWWQVNQFQTPPCAPLLSDLLRAIAEACKLGASLEHVQSGFPEPPHARLGELERSCFARRRDSAPFRLALRITG